MSVQLIGRYEIKAELGRGGMATVYKAYDPTFKRDVAIKVLPREFSHDPLFASRFKREAEMIAKLEHPAIVPVYDYGEEVEQTFLVMRFMGGGSLADRLERGPLPLTDILIILDRMAPALDKAHAMGIVHRDLKSGNILFDDDGNAFLSDFGIAKMTEGGPTGLTGTGSMIGTPAYMSPEQARGDPGTDGRSDLYSMGVILFEMLTGDLPFTADTPMGIAIKHITDPVPRVLNFAPDLPPRCEAVVVRAMNKDPENRYQTLAEMVTDMRSAVSTDLGGMTTVVMTPGVVPDTKELPAVAHIRPGAVPMWGWVAGGAAALVLIGGITLGAGGALTPATPNPTVETAGGATSTPTETPAPTPTTEPSAVGGGAGQIAWISGPDFRGNVYVMSTACVNEPELCSGGFPQLTSGLVNVHGPAWSPDGTRIAFRAADNSGNNDIYVMDADGTNLTRLTQDPGDDISPAWSPDGTRIIFTAERDGDFELHIMNADGSGQTRLTENEVDDYYPSWSPDGTQILFYSRRDSNTDIYLVDAACIESATCDTGQVRLTFDEAADYEPVWSPDGAQIVFVSERDGNAEIYVMNADGSAQTRLTDSPSSDRVPAWSPDGTLIAFSSNRDGDRELYLIAPDGSGLLRLTNISADDTDPAWHP